MVITSDSVNDYDYDYDSVSHDVITLYILKDENAKCVMNEFMRATR